MLLVPRYIPDIPDLLSDAFYYKIPQFVAIVNSNYHNSVFYFTTNIISMKDYFQALHLIFYFQKKEILKDPKLISNLPMVIFMICWMWWKKEVAMKAKHFLTLIKIHILAFLISKTDTGYHIQGQP